MVILYCFRSFLVLHIQANDPAQINFCTRYEIMIWFISLIWSHPVDVISFIEKIIFPPLNSGDTCVVSQVMMQVWI